MANPEGKDAFYPKVREALSRCGYLFWADIRGKGRSHASKPDYIAARGDVVVIGEIKSPAEGPLSPSWRVPQGSGTPEFTAVRRDVGAREKNGTLSRAAGGHEIILRGQIPDYVRKLGHTYDLPKQCPAPQHICGGYSAPAAEARHIEEAFANCGRRYLQKIESNGSVSYIFTL